MAEWTYLISLVVPNADQAHVLFVADGDQWKLPLFTLQTVFNNLYMLSRSIKAEMGADMVVLRTLARQADEEAHMTRVVWLMENRSQDWNPAEDARWVDRRALDGLTLVDEWMRPALETCLDTLTSPAPAERPDWFQPGWFAQAEVWINTVLAAQGYTLLRPVEQFKQGTISSVLRVETSAGHIYFKVALTLPLFGNEPKLCSILGQLYPQYVSAPIAIDEARRWMLSTDFGSELRNSNPDVAVLETVVKSFARLQIETAGKIDTLFAAGCLDRRIEVLMGQIDDLLADEACYAELKADEKTAWQACGDRLKALCQQVTTYNLPYTLVHGDFHAGNIATQGERVLFFDWTDACVAHPFFDLPVLIGDDLEAHTEVLREVYLAEWTAYEPLERLREAYDIASVLGALHQAVSYRGIMNGVEADQRASWSFGVPIFARRILQQLKALH